MHGRSHDYVSAELFDSFFDFFVTRGDPHFGHFKTHRSTTKHMLNHGAIKQPRQRFSRKTRRAQARGNYRDDSVAHFDLSESAETGVE